MLIRMARSDITIPDNAEDLAAAAETATHILATGQDDAALASARRAIQRVWPAISQEGQSYAIGYALGSLRERRRLLTRMYALEHVQGVN